MVYYPDRAHGHSEFFFKFNIDLYTSLNIGSIPQSHLKESDNVIKNGARLPRRSLFTLFEGCRIRETDFGRAF